MAPTFESVVPRAEDLERELTSRFGAGVTLGEVDRCVAVLVTGRATVRSTWVDDAEVSEGEFERLLAEAPPQPSLDATQPVEFRALDPASRGAKVRRCTLCQFSPSDAKCPHCNGTREIVSDGSVSACLCVDGKAPPCSACGGSRRTVPVKIWFGEDLVRTFARIFLPNLAPTLRDPLSRFFSARTSVPDVLSIDLLEDSANVDAYRGRRSRGEVRGHRADAALVRARGYLERVDKLPSVVSSRSAAFAWPFLVGVDARNPSTPLAVVNDELGGVHALP